MEIFGTDIDLNGNEFKHLRPENLLSFPVSPDTGQIIMHTGLGSFFGYDGITWRDLALGGGGSYTLPVASDIILGGVKVDGSTINIDGSGVISASSAASGLELITDGGTGWRLIGSDPIKFGGIGNESVDLTVIDFYNTGDRGITAPFSFGAGADNKMTGGGYSQLLGFENEITSTQYANTAIGGYNKIGSNSYGNTAIGVYNELNSSSNGFVFVAGMNNRAYGDVPAGAIGTALDVHTRNHFAVGSANVVSVAGNTASDRPVFTVGIGSYTTPGAAWQAVVRKDGFNVLYDGQVIADSLTTTMIDSGSSRMLTTKEWVLANSGGGGAFEVINEGSGDGIVISGRTSSRYGDIGLRAFDVSYSSSSSSVRGATGNYSVAFGYNTQAESTYAFVAGRDSIANAASASFGEGCASNGAWAFTAGKDCSAENNFSASIGQSSNALGFAAMAFGASCDAYAYSITAGQNNLASGSHSVAFGSSSIASGNYSIALGRENYARSYGEIALGIYSTDYVGNTTTFVSTERIFNIGNGSTNLSPSDAFTVLKNGNTSIGKSNFEVNDTGAKLQVEGTIESKGYTVATLPSGTIGERAYVTDATVVAFGNFGATVFGGGANVVPVFYNGTNWIIA